MSIAEQQHKLIVEANVLMAHFNIPAEAQQPLQKAVDNFTEAWTRAAYVDPEELSTLMYAINDAIEDVCLAHRITDEQLESHCKQIKAY